MHGRVVFELLRTSGSRGLIQAGRFSEGRTELAKALREAGLACGPLVDRTDEELASSEGAWVVLLGTEMENGWVMQVVPTSCLDDRARAALTACDRAIFTVDSPFEEPERYASFVHVLALAERCVWADVIPVIEGSPTEALVDERDFDGAYGRWAGLQVRDAEARAAALDRRIERIVEIYEQP